MLFANIPWYHWGGIKNIIYYLTIILLNIWADYDIVLLLYDVNMRACEGRKKNQNLYYPKYG